MGRYLAPFSLMNEWCLRHTVDAKLRIEAAYDEFLDVVRKVLAPVPVDEQWYAAEYPGVASAIAGGAFGSASQHYAVHGYFENRLPFRTEEPGRRLPIGFAELKATLNVVPTRAGLRVHFERQEFVRCIQALLAGVPVDEEYYRSRYPEVYRNPDPARPDTGARHFVANGYFECRWPFSFPLDEGWYLNQYPDVRTEIEQGKVPSAEEHFRRRGYQQGRLPMDL